MEIGRETPTDDIDALRAELAVARARAAEDQALIAHQNCRSRN